MLFCVFCAIIFPCPVMMSSSSTLSAVVKADRHVRILQQETMLIIQFDHNIHTTNHNNIMHPQSLEHKLLKCIVHIISCLTNCLHPQKRRRRITGSCCMLSLDRLTADCTLRTKQTFVQGTHSGGGFQKEKVKCITFLCFSQG